MDEILIKFKTAILAKEKGININYHRTYITKEKFPNDKIGGLCYESYDNQIPNRVGALSQSLVQKWLREVHNIEVYVVPYSLDLKKMIGGRGYYEVIVEKAVTTWSEYETYEEALEKGLLEALKLI